MQKEAHATRVLLSLDESHLQPRDAQYSIGTKILFYSCFFFSLIPCSAFSTLQQRRVRLRARAHATDSGLTGARDRRASSARRGGLRSRASASG